MGQDEVFAVLKKHEGEWFSTKDVAIMLDYDRVSVATALRKLWRRRRHHGFNDIDRLFKPIESGTTLEVMYQFNGFTQIEED